MPTTPIKRNTYTIDATNQAPGRLASRVAALLRGKDRTDYAPHIDAGAFVKVINASKLKITGDKLEQKEYRHHSFHPGGEKFRPMKVLMEQKPEEVIELAVRRMIPDNRLRKPLMKRLTVKR
jgi:large subunit ribosomal protein L13